MEFKIRSSLIHILVFFNGCGGGVVVCVCVCEGGGLGLLGFFNILCSKLLLNSALFIRSPFLGNHFSFSYSQFLHSFII